MSKLVCILFALAFATCVLSSCNYDADVDLNHYCADCFAESVSCETISAFNVSTGDLYAEMKIHFVPLASAYYMSRLAQALGYSTPNGGGRCANKAFLASMNINTPWSGIHGPERGVGIAIDGAFGYKRIIERNCPFPNPPWPFLCTGVDGTPGTEGDDLGTLSYIPLLNDTANNKWALFGHCWNAKTRDHPYRVTKAVSWNVFSLDKALSQFDEDLILARLDSIGFNIDDSDIIRSLYTPT